MTEDMAEKRKRVNWRNVAMLVLLMSPLLYFSDRVISPPQDAPLIWSKEGRAIVRNYLRRHFPELVANGGRIR